MSAEHHAEATANPADLFPPKEWAFFRTSDTMAAKAIVLLMLAIFVIGIVLYSIVLATL
ncbi:MAG TPA: hypothetical protein VE988_25780 [Gemmataceae bacterium]|nr:hypothetical protein [Gemmataceae bacterium]